VSRPNEPYSSATGRTTDSGTTRCSITDMSRFTSTPPLNAAIGVVRSSGSMSIDMPRGGRPLVIANRIPASPSLRTALMARSVRTLSGVTSVPSTSARSSRMALFMGFLLRRN
jgi:hypothetical protein